MNPGFAVAQPGLRKDRGGTITRCGALFASVLLAGCATKPVDLYEGIVVRDHGMSPYVIHEECLRVAAGERIDYSFTSTQPVDFNIHFHDTGVVVMPIVRDKILEDSLLFAPVIPQDYCLMWEAGPAGATLDYQVRLRPPLRP
jgi:hypothetical protein